MTPAASKSAGVAGALPRVFGHGPNSIDPADRQDLRCDACHGSGERVVNTDDSGDPMYDRAIDCPECGGAGFVDPFSADYGAAR